MKHLNINKIHTMDPVLISELINYLGIMFSGFYFAYLGYHPLDNNNDILDFIGQIITTSFMLSIGTLLGSIAWPIILALCLLNFITKKNETT